MGPSRGVVLLAALPAAVFAQGRVSVPQSLPGAFPDSAVTRRVADASSARCVQRIRSLRVNACRRWWRASPKARRGEWWKGVRVTDSPYDTFDTPHAQFAIGADDKPRMDRYVFDGAVLPRRAPPFPLTALNHLDRQTLEAAVLYTPRMGVTPRDTVRAMSEVPLRAVSRGSDSSVWIVAGPPANVGGHAIAAGGAVLAAYGPRSKTIAAFTPGDTVAIVVRAAVNSQPSTLNPRPLDRPQLLVGAWPRILARGVVVADRAPWDEGTLSTNAEAWHPRSAIGFSPDSATIYLMTVDGRSEDSGGMTLVELALFLKSQGVSDALNFDDGGSSTLVVRGRVVNVPSDRAGERAVGNAILVVVRPRARVVRFRSPRRPPSSVRPADYIARRSLYLPERARYGWIMQQAAVSGADLPGLVTWLPAVTVAYPLHSISSQWLDRPSRRNSVQGMKRVLGRQETQMLAYLQMRKMRVVRTGELAGPLRLSVVQERELFRRMARGKLIARVRPGLYLVPDKLPLGGVWTPSAALALDAMMADRSGNYQICGPNAFNRYGFSEQVPNLVYAYNNRISGERTVGAVSLVLIKVADERLGGTETTTGSDGVAARWSSRARTLVDAVYDWSRFGSLPRAYGWIKAELANGRVSSAELARQTLRYGDIATVRRIGVLLETLDVPSSTLGRLARTITPTTGSIAFNPGNPKRGTLSRRWGVVMNAVD